MSHLLKNFLGSIDKFYVLPIRTIHFAPKLAIQPLLCVLAIRDPRAAGPAENEGSRIDAARLARRVLYVNPGGISTGRHAAE